MPTRPARILLVDDDPLVQRIGASLFLAPTYMCAVAATAAEALVQLAQFKPEVVILDNLLPDRSGLELLAEIHAHDRNLPVLFITAAGSSNTTIAAMKRGAFDFLAKPLDLDALATQVQHALQSRRLMLTPVELAPQRESQEPSPVLVGQSDAMREVYKAIGRVALHDDAVLIVGEPGTGKELVARLVHEHGSRSQGVFQSVACGDFDLPWLESELFGHEAGAFPGTTAQRIGKIEQCHGGVLLLKDIGDLPLVTQGKLVELLRERRFQRLGGSEALSADLTILASAAEDLESSIAGGRFRADLFYALNSFTIALPPLRARRQDIPLLVDYFVKRFTRIERTLNGGVTRVSEDALALIAQYDWPGNVDELQSVLKRALVEGKGTVLATAALAQSLAGTHDRQSQPSSAATHWTQLVEQELAGGGTRLYELAVEEMERRMLPLVMDRCGGNQVKASRALGITRGSLRKKLRHFGLIAPSALAAEQSEASAADVEP